MVGSNALDCPSKEWALRKVWSLEEVSGKNHVLMEIMSRFLAGSWHEGRWKGEENTCPNPWVLQLFDLSQDGLNKAVCGLMLSCVCLVNVTGNSLRADEEGPGCEKSLSQNEEEGRGVRKARGLEIFWQEGMQAGIAWWWIKAGKGFSKASRGGARARLRGAVHLALRTPAWL